MMDNLGIKADVLRRRLRDLGGAVVAFSGGVDSSLLTVIAHKELGGRMCAVTAISPSFPRRDKELVIRICKRRGISHEFVETREFDDSAFIMNPENRCYFCKKHIYEALKEVADRKGFKFVIEGTNISDLSGHRPGYQASKELGFVVTPLIDAQMTKDEVRVLARKLRIESADKPSAACLSSRMQIGDRLDPKILERIDDAEDYLRSLGVSQVRVRHHDEFARIEVTRDDFKKILTSGNDIHSYLKELGWKFITLDIIGYRSGGAAG